MSVPFFADGKKKQFGSSNRLARARKSAKAAFTSLLLAGRRKVAEVSGCAETLL